MSQWKFLSRVTLKFDGWPWKTIGHLFCATSSFVQDFEAIHEIKLELQLDTHGCVLSTVTTDDLVLKHQGISIHSAD